MEDYVVIVKVTSLVDDKLMSVLQELQGVLNHAADHRNIVSGDVEAVYKEVPTERLHK